MKKKKYVVIGLIAAFLVVGLFLIFGKEKTVVAGQDITLWANLDIEWKDPENGYSAYDYGIGVDDYDYPGGDGTDVDISYREETVSYSKELIDLIKSLTFEDAKLANKDIDTTIPYHRITLCGYNKITEKQVCNNVEFWFFDNFNYVIAKDFYDMGIYKVGEPEKVRQFFVVFVEPDINRYPEYSHNLYLD